MKLKRPNIICKPCLLAAVQHIRKTSPHHAGLPDQELVQRVVQAGLHQNMAVEYEFLVDARGPAGDTVQRKALYYTCPQCSHHETHVPYEVLMCQHCGKENRLYPPVTTEGTDQEGSGE